MNWEWGIFSQAKSLAVEIVQLRKDLRVSTPVFLVNYQPLKWFFANMKPGHLTPAFIQVVETSSAHVADVLKFSWPNPGWSEIACFMPIRRGIALGKLENDSWSCNKNDLTKSLNLPRLHPNPNMRLPLILDMSIFIHGVAFYQPCFVPQHVQTKPLATAQKNVRLEVSTTPR